MPAAKIAVAGGGSLSFTPGLFYQLVREPAVAGSTVWLFDPDLPAAELMGRLARRMIAEAGADLQVEVTADRAAALAGADIVSCTIAVGGLAAFRDDIEVPLRYGLAHSVGDSVGPAGIFRAMRMVPAFLEIARDMERLCPDAWLVNFSNPMAAICRAVARETTIKVVGLCHGYMNTLWEIAPLLGVPPEETTAHVMGVNHLIFFTHLSHHGRDLLPALRELLLADPACRGPVTNALYRLYGLYLANGDRHVAEFFPWFFGDRSAGGHRYGLSPNSIDERAAKRRRQVEQFAAMADGREPVKAFGNERAIDVLLAHLGARAGSFVANVGNDGQYPGLPPYALLEGNVRMVGDEMRFDPLQSLPAGITSLLTECAARQELTVEAAVSGDSAILLQALTADPMCSNMTVEDVRSMMEERLRRDTA